MKTPLTVFVLFGVCAFAQGPVDVAFAWEQGPPVDSRRSGPPPSGRQQLPSGRWWTEPALIERLNLTDEQQNRIDDVFQQQRLKLIDLTAALGKEEAILEPMLDAERPDEARVVEQIDRVTRARGELEKANARMLLGFRAVLTQDQWKRLRAEQPRGRGGPGGPGGPHGGGPRR